jgi:alpha/beta superfamily hydrolase
MFIPNGGSEEKAAVVWTGGSSDGAYHNYNHGLIETYVLDVFLERDMVVILTNKRGVGKSEGNWAHQGIEGRAAIWLRWSRWLRHTRPLMLITSA